MQPRASAVTKVQWAVREAKGSDRCVCLLPPKAEFTACGLRLYRSRTDPNLARNSAQVWSQVTVEPLRASCNLCRKMLRRTLFSGASEAEVQEEYARLFRGEKSRSESSGPHPWRTRKIRNLSARH